MRRRETGLLIAGLALGAVTSAVFLNRNPSDMPEMPPAQTGAQAPMPTPPAIPSDAAVQLTADEQRQIGIQTIAVQRQTVTEQITAIGRVEERETTIRTISARVGGRIETLLVNFTGQPVRDGQPVAEIYSPEIVTAAEEYKLAVENRQHLSASQQVAALAQADALISASRRRLELWGLSEEQIDQLIAAETPLHITIYSSVTGIVRSRNITEGQYVNAGDALFDVIDLSSVWVEADVFQADISRIRPGLRAQVVSDALPGVTLRGTVSFITPQSDAASRTTPVRIEVANPGMRLRPGMFVRSVFDIPLGTNVLTAPRSAVIDTGMEKSVYLALPDGVFQRRTIQTGAPTKDFYPVTSGLAEGDMVVTHGAFLIDSQTRLADSLTGLFGGSTSFDESESSAYRIVFRTVPDPPVGAEDNTAHVTITDSSGNPVTDAQVRMTIIMPAMPSMGMPEMRGAADLPWSGSTYSGPISVSMRGSWNVVVEARRGDQLLATYRSRFDAR